MRRRILASGIGLSLAWLAGTAIAQDPWWEIPGAPRAMPSRAASSSPANGVSLGRPVPLVPDEPQQSDQFRESGIRRAAYTPAQLAPPTLIVRAQASEPVPTSPIGPPPIGPAYPVAPQERYNSGVVVEPPAGAPAGKHGWFDWMTPGSSSAGGHGDRQFLQSDHCFDNFISPVTSPFYFEDPRALTEVRPVFIWQKVPTDNYLYQGGSIFFFGTQLRLAFTDWFSVVVPKLGWIWNDPSHSDPFREFTQANGFAELMIGPKFTFLRNDCTNTVVAGGLNFDIPVGSANVFQDTGKLSLIPYFSWDQRVAKTSYGDFNMMLTPSYSFRVDNARTDTFNLSIHFDYDVANLHKFYPLIEMNYTNYTRAGKVNYFGFEGRDLFNYGSHAVSGQTDLTLAFGGRYKFSECIQFGIAAEFPIVGGIDIQKYRLTTDFIIRF